MALILVNWAIPFGLLALAPPVAWAIERGAVRLDHADGTPPRRMVVAAAAVAVALSAAIAFDGAAAALAALLGWALLALARIDLGAGLLPDRLTAPVALAGLAVAGLDAPDALLRALVGMAAGFAALAGVAWLYRRWRGRDGMGLGDAKLLGAAGAWLGAASLPLTVCLAATSALAAVLTARRFGWRLERDGAIPFGPFLCLAVWIVFLTRGDMLG